MATTVSDDDAAPVTAGGGCKEIDILSKTTNASRHGRMLESAVLHL